MSKKQKLIISKEEHMKTAKRSSRPKAKPMTMEQYERSSADKKADKMALRRINRKQKSSSRSEA